MSTEFPYDVFLSHSAKDKAVVRPLAERLRQDGLKVWFDEWVLKPGVQTSKLGSSRRELAQTVECSEKRMSGLTSAATTEEMTEAGLERSRVLPLAHQMGEGARRTGEGGMSAHAFGSDWAHLACPPVASARRRKASTCGRRNWWERRLAVRDPLNRARRFIPLRLDDAPIKGYLAQFLYINWRPADREQESSTISRTFSQAQFYEPI